MEGQNLALRAAKLGLITGLVYAALTFLLYTIDRSLYAHYMLRFIPLLIVVGMMYYTTNDRYVRVGNTIHFKHLVQASFLVLVIAEGIWRLMDFSLHNYIDPTLGEFVKQETISWYEKSMLKGGANQMNIDMMKAQINAEDNSVTFEKSIKGYFAWIFYGFVFSFIVALVVKFIHKNSFNQEAK